MSRLSTDELDDIRARNPVADVAGGYVKLRRAGKQLTGPCPICGGRAGSARFVVFEGGDRWACVVCQADGDVIELLQKLEGCDFKTAVERLGGRREIDRDAAARAFEDREKKRLEREAASARYRENERQRLWSLWKAALPIHETPAAEYLAGRGLLLPPRCPGLRFAPKAPYWHGDALDERGYKAPRAIHVGPAMIAAFIRSDGHFGGLHVTWLSSDLPRRKLELADPDTGEMLNAKKMRGSKTGAHIMIAACAAPARRLVIGEGIETVLSVWTAYRVGGRLDGMTAFWAAGDLGNLAGRALASVKHPELKRPNGHAVTVPGPLPDPDDPGLTIPAQVDEIVLLGDGDSEPFLTRNAMERAAKRYVRRGRSIRVAFAPDGADFNDVLAGSDD